MTFLSPWTAIFAAAIAVPVLLLLYFLKLRRQAVRIPSTLLWQKSFEDLQVNAPFQRLRWSMLLALQLLVLLLLLMALGDPVFQGDQAFSRRVILLVDRSASMNALLRSGSDAEQAMTRLDSAKRLAREHIERIGRGNGAEEIMIISFARNALVISGFTSDRQTLLNALDSIEPTEEQGDLDAALQLAGAFLGNRDESEELSPPGVVLISDGNIAPSTQAEGHRMRAGRFTFVQAVPGIEEQTPNAMASNNIGFTALGARRNVDNPEQVSIFARLINVGSEPVEIIITIMVDEQAVASLRRTIPGIDAGLPGESFLSHQIDALGAATIVLRHNYNDDLAADNVGALVLPAPSRPRVLLVHPNDASPDSFLHDLLQAAELQQLDTRAEDAYALSDSTAEAGQQYDLIVFDRVNADRLPGVPTLSVGATPAIVRSDVARSDEAHHILSWDRQNPLMRNVSLDTIVYSGFGSYTLPSSATALAFGPEGPVIAAFRTRGVRHVAIGFEMVRSNWPLHISSAIFLQNLLETLPGRQAGRDDLVMQPGETISVRAMAQASQVTIDGPIRFTMNVQPGSIVNLPPLHRTGTYAIRGASPPHQTIAISMLSDVESDIRPVSSVTVNAESALAHRDGGLSSIPIWPWLVAAAFMLMVIEWLVYSRRAIGR